MLWFTSKKYKEDSMGVATLAQSYNFTSALARTVVKYESLSAGKKADFQRTVVQSKVAEAPDTAKKDE
jgi:hypothetical protein